MKKRRSETMDGNTAVAYISYAFTDVAAIFPITPSSDMAEAIDQWSAEGRKNIFGKEVIVKEMQSEGGAAGTLHGCLQGGALATTYTASQGLLLMIPNMYKIAGELLPGVFHVSSRSLASNALSIFGDHQDVMSTRQTGFALLASNNVQQCMDLGAVAHLASIKTRIPTLHFFDGFRTSHEIQKIELLEHDEMAELVDWDAIERFRFSSLNPNRPVLRGTTQNPDIFFQTREAVNRFYEPIPETFEYYMGEIKKLTGREYHLFNYYGSDSAADAVIAMGSACDVIRETIRYKNSKGCNFGLLEVHLYRPFSSERMIRSLPKTVRRICVLDRTKEPGAEGDPLYMDVRNAFFGWPDAPLIIGGRYGLASKDFTPDQVMAVFDNLRSSKPMDQFTVGIVDDVTFKSLPQNTVPFNPSPESIIACKLWGLGSDGTVGANKTAVKIIGNHTEKYVQAYFAYDSKKSGGVTISHLRFSDEPITASYLVKQANFIACHNQSYVNKYDLLDGIKKGGIFLLNTIWDDGELDEYLPARMKRTMAEKQVRFYTINAVKTAEEIGLGHRVNMIMQAAFFKLTNIMPLDESIQLLKEYCETEYGNQGQNVVDMNRRAIDAGTEGLHSVTKPEYWSCVLEEEPLEILEQPEFVERILIPVNRQEGDSIPVSAFLGREDGSYPTETTKYEKRAVSIYVPEWDPGKCIQCNRCSFVCPHSVLRPALLSREQVDAAPEEMKYVKAAGYKDKFYAMGVSALDCYGCGNCVDVCIAKEKALTMKPLAAKRKEYEKRWDYMKDLELEDVSGVNIKTVKGSQFLKPLFEFSVACAGCGETPYAKLVTQLFGDRMVISAAAGCSTVWGGSAPSVPYAKNKYGRGPAWGFSLFEDNAEYGYGLHLGANAVREIAVKKVKDALPAVTNTALKTAMNSWLAGLSVSEGTFDRAGALIEALEAEDSIAARDILKFRDYFIKQSNWIFGGDGWAYDIGYGGLDHVLSAGEDINVLVFDTEVYSNTGGQSSKATPTAAIAKFAASGKKTKKKDLGMMAMSYGYVYVAQIAMGADMNQTLKAIVEAEAYPGPSLIIAYAPCVNHGIKGGMGKSQKQAERAVEAGYWSLYRYNPLKKKEGENPFTLDSKPPTASFEEFLMSEVRYSSLVKQYPDQAAVLIEKARMDAIERLENYTRLSRG